MSCNYQNEIFRTDAIYILQVFAICNKETYETMESTKILSKPHSIFREKR